MVRIWWVVWKPVLWSEYIGYKYRYVSVEYNITVDNILKELKVLPVPSIRRPSSNNLVVKDKLVQEDVSGGYNVHPDPNKASSVRVIIVRIKDNMVSMSARVLERVKATSMVPIATGNIMLAKGGYK